MVAVEIQQAAMRLLARREHSQKELKTKLLQRFPEQATEIDAAIALLLEEDLLSEQRFCEAYVRARIVRGYGPVRIRVELQERGIESVLSEAALALDEAQWIAHARQAYLKRFDVETNQTTTVQEHAKQINFLRYRGFTSDQIRRALKETPHHENS